MQALNVIDPVLLCNDLGRTNEAIPENLDIGGSMSVKEAVRIAQSNNLMGLICRSQLLVSLALSPVPLAVHG